MLKSQINAKCLRILLLLFFVMSVAADVKAQYLGVTCGYDYNNDLRGPNTGTSNTPLFNSMPSNPQATWDEWVEELAASGVDYVCPNLRGSYPNTSVNPTNIAGLLLALKNRGLTNQIKLAIFDDNASSWTAQYNQALGYGYGYTVPFDIADTNNWVYLWDYNYKLFYETVPDSNRFKIDGRPVIIIWTGNTYFISNMQGNASRALMYVRQQCQSTFGFNPYIILSSDFLAHDTTCNNPNVTDAIESWFTPNNTHTNGSTLETFNGVKIGALCPQFQNPITVPTQWLDPKHGTSFAHDLTQTRGAGALLTLVEGFTDWEEDAAVFRVRNLDANGNSLDYTNTYYDYPSQRINILRQYGNNPFPDQLKFEAESCDSFGGAAGGNGKVNFFRNGNIAIEPTSDVGGGYDVGWIQPGQWLEWLDVPIQGGSVHLQARVASPNDGCQLHFVVDGTPYPAVIIPNTGGLQNFTTIDCVPPQVFPQGSRHTVRLVCDTTGFNLNYWQFHNDIPIGSIIELKAEANNLWVSASNATLIANAPSAGTNEQFLVTDASGIYEYGVVALKSLANGKYVTVDTNGTMALPANSTSIGTPQLFRWNDNGDGTISLRALANQMAVTAENAGASPLVANRLNVGLWETFALTVVSTNTLSFVAQPNNVVAGTSLTAGALGEVQVLALDGNTNPIIGTVVNIALGSGTGIANGSNSAVTDGSGIAHFTNLQINKIGSKTLMASCGMASVQSDSFLVTQGSGSVAQLIWAKPPGLATNGYSFGVSPVIQTADTNGNATTLGLPTVKLIQVSIYSGSGALFGTTITNIGTAGGNGTVTLKNLGINSAGTFQLKVKDIGNGYDPTNITGADSCQLWLDAADNSTLTSSGVGSAISQWKDKSGRANNAVGTATLVTDPLLNAASPGQARAIHFNGSQQLAMDLSSLSNSAYTILVMEVGAGKAGSSSYFIGNQGGYNTDLTLGIGYQTGTQFRWQQYADDLNYNDVFTNTAARQWTMNLNSSPSITKKLYLNSTLVGTASSGFLKGSYLVNGTIGTGSYLGDLAEVIVYNTSLSVDEQTNLQSYLMNKWLSGLSTAITLPFNVNAFVYSPAINNVAIEKTGGAILSITLSGTNGSPNGTYRVLSSTNLNVSTAAWIPISTNVFDNTGAFSTTIPVSAVEPARFYKLIQP